MERKTETSEKGEGSKKRVKREGGGEMQLEDKKDRKMDGYRESDAGEG